MKSRILTLIFFVFSIGYSFSQSEITLCHTPATESFAMLASNSEFNSDHREPLPYKHMSEAGKMITYDTPDGKTANAFMLEAKVQSDNYVVVFHEWWGLNDYIKKEAEKIYHDFEETVNVVALDLYDGKVADTREKASEYMQSVDTDRATAIINGFYSHAGEGREYATIGWCFGGGWSLQAALLAKDDLRGCVMYYGMPEKNVNRLKDLQAPVLGIFAKQDGRITPQVVDNFKANMAEAGKELRIEMYDAGHAFANPSNPDYDKEAAKKAYDEALEFMKKSLN